jgi:hypothetical protein
MAGILVAFYPHGRNKEGSYDSICLDCFATVAFGKSKAELTEFDKTHVCIPSAMVQRTFDRRELEEDKNQTYLRYVRTRKTRASR